MQLRYRDEKESGTVPPRLSRSARLTPGEAPSSRRGVRDARGRGRGVLLPPVLLIRTGRSSTPPPSNAHPHPPLSHHLSTRIHIYCESHLTARCSCPARRCLAVPCRAVRGDSGAALANAGSRTTAENGSRSGWNQVRPPYRCL